MPVSAIVATGRTQSSRIRSRRYGASSRSPRGPERLGTRLGMATNPPKRQAQKLQDSVIRWLFDSDPSIRWQVMRDLIGAPADEVAAERARVATEGAGARLLALQGG